MVHGAYPQLAANGRLAGDEKTVLKTSVSGDSVDGSTIVKETCSNNQFTVFHLADVTFRNQHSEVATHSYFGRLIDVQHNAP